MTSGSHLFLKEYEKCDHWHYEKAFCFEITSKNTYFHINTIACASWKNSARSRDFLVQEKWGVKGDIFQLFDFGVAFSRQGPMIIVLLIEPTLPIWKLSFSGLILHMWKLCRCASIPRVIFPLAKSLPKLIICIFLWKL